MGLLGEYQESATWKKRIKLFELMVIIGVVGELWADGCIFIFSEHLQTISDTEIAELDKRLIRSNNELLAAHNEALAAWLTARDLADQNLKRKADRPSRELTLKEQLALAESCRAFAGTRVRIVHLTLDAEGSRLARQIQAALEYAHIAVVNNSQLKGGPIGVTILGSAPKRDLVRAIVGSLITDGILTTSKLLERDGDTEVQIGVRPLTLIAPNASSEAIKMQ
ncbi:MAG: hypothetical protein ACR2IV_16320 [Bryobacteraceae bacterium]